MHRIDGRHHKGGKFYFPQEGAIDDDPPTQLTAEWLNSVQEELASVVEASGFSLKKSESNQVLNAIKKMADQEQIRIELRLLKEQQFVGQNNLRMALDSDVFEIVGKLEKLEKEISLNEETSRKIIKDANFYFSLVEKKEFDLSARIASLEKSNKEYAETLKKINLNIREIREKVYPRGDYG